MANQNPTVFQKLTKMFGFPGQIKQDQAPTFNFSKDELLKTDSREDYEKAMLQAQQSQYIADKWTKLDQSLYNQSVYYEPNRMAAYYDYESMEFTPEVSAALDIYAEESTTMSEKGEILTIELKEFLKIYFIIKWTLILTYKCGREVWQNMVTILFT